MQQTLSSLKKYKLISSSSFKKFNAAQNIEQYICDCYNYRFSCQRKSVQQNKNLTSQTLQLLQKSFISKQQKAWIKLIFIEQLLNKCDSQILNIEFCEYLSFQCEQLEKNYLKQQIEERSLVRKLSQGLLRVKSSIFGFENNKENEVISSKFLNRIINQIKTIVRKKLQNNKFFIQLRTQNNKIIKINNQQKQESFNGCRQKVWKMINLSKHHTNIIKGYRNFESIQLSIKPLIVITFNLFAMDFLKMYPWIVQLVQNQLEIIGDKLNEINSRKGIKQMRRKKLQQLSNSQIFLQLKNLLKQLEQINMTVFYVFMCQHHRQYMRAKLPSNFILNVGNPRLDFFYSLIKQIEDIKQRKQRVRQNLYKQSQKLNKSLSSTSGYLDNSSRQGTNKLLVQRREGLKQIFPPNYFSKQIVQTQQSEDNFNLIANIENSNNIRKKSSTYCVNPYQLHIHY